MSKFTSEFNLNRGIGIDVWRLGKPLYYESDILERLIRVPQGFETDFASIPRFFHRLIPKNGLHDPAAVIHDYLYSRNGRVGLFELPRKVCDQIFLEAMEVVGVGWFNRHAMYRAVRSFGWAAWNGHARRIAEDQN